MVEWESVVDHYERLAAEQLVESEVEVTDLGEISATELEYIIRSNAIAEAEAAMERRLVEAKRQLNEYERLKFEVARMKLLHALAKERLKDQLVYDANGKKTIGVRSVVYR
jgi:hypothetical protein